MLIQFYIHLHAYSLNALLRIRLWATTHCPCMHVCSFNFTCDVNSFHIVVTFLYVKERCNFYIVLVCMHAYSILHPLAWSLNAWLVSGSNRIGLWATSSRSVGFLSNAPPKWSIHGHRGRPPSRRGLIFLIVSQCAMQWRTYRVCRVVPGIPWPNSRRSILQEYVKRMLADWTPL
jgi:hypothetical protein